MLTKEQAKLAWAKGEELQWTDSNFTNWNDLDGDYRLRLFDDEGVKFRIKHQMKEVDKRIFYGITGVEANRNSREITVMYHPDVDIMMVYELIGDLMSESHSNSD